jgi:hypothetical protein
MVDKLKVIYEELEKCKNVRYQYPTKGHVKIRQIIKTAPTNFTMALNYPIHRWYYYKEGFSPTLVEGLIEAKRYDKGFTVLDPFCGGGTTPVVCMLKGVPSIGLEVNPFSSFLTKVKTRLYTKEDIKSFQKHIDKIRTLRGKPSIDPPKMSMVNRLFESYILEGLLFYKEHIKNALDDGEKVRDLLMLGWLAILEDVSNYRKAGNGLKLKTPTHRKAILDRYLEEPAIIRQKLVNKYRTMLEDLRKTILIDNRIEPLIHDPSVSALNMKSVVPDDYVSVSIFSPTYANCFDYCEIYKVELWMGEFVKAYSDLKILRQRSLRSHLNMNLGNVSYHNPIVEEVLSGIPVEKLWDKRIPMMIRGYFDDMHSVFRTHMDILKERGKMVVVVANSAYGDVVIPTDLIFCEVAESVGFKTLYVDVIRPEVTSSQQFAKLEKRGINHFMRESILYFEKS